MLPDFLIVGTQKAATSWLATCLSEHPDVFMVDVKEIHTFFEEDDQYGVRGRGCYFEQLSRYFECFPCENLSILVYEEIKKERQRTIQDCYAQLNEDMSQELVYTYMQYLVQLEHLLDRDLSVWYAPARVV